MLNNHLSDGFIKFSKLLIEDKILFDMNKINKFITAR
jgi:hypothetical protein